MTKRLDLTIRQGQTWNHVYTHADAAGDPVDLTGYSAAVAIVLPNSAFSEAYLTTSPATSFGSITLGGAAGTVTLAMTAAQSSAFGATASIELITTDRRSLPETLKYLYALELAAPDGSVVRALEGHLFLSREVTS